MDSKNIRELGALISDLTRMVQYFAQLEDRAYEDIAELAAIRERARNIGWESEDGE